MARVRTSNSADEVRNAPGPGSQPPDYGRPEGLRLDDRGMVLPHSILGSLEDFRSYLEARGETELVRRLPKSRADPSSELPGHESEAAEDRQRIPLGHGSVQSNALQRWFTHMRLRREQQDVLSGLLQRPVEHLLMNHADGFRETQEQRQVLTRLMSLVRPGYGCRVGSEFWSLPQRYGDELSGIIATLNRTERGIQEPVARVRKPASMREEAGIFCAENLRPASRFWDKSEYLRQQYRELGEYLGGQMDIEKPAIQGLEVIGSSKPSTFARVRHSPLLEVEEEEEKGKEVRTKKRDPLVCHDDVQQGSLLPSPALRFCGQLASWAGSAPARQAEEGISATMIFEAATGERASSHLELRNEGGAGIFFSWQQLPSPPSFSNLRSQTNSPHFYFNSSSDAILPGETKLLEIIFMSEKPGVRTEQWQLNTHPMLLQGAPIRLTLRGVSLYQDRTASQRKFLEAKLEKAMMLKTCQVIMNEVLQRVHTPERPSSPAELSICEKQRFMDQNPHLQYLDQPVEDLRRMWQEINPGCTWNLSADTLRQSVLSLPEQPSTEDADAREESLAQLNSLVLKLSEPSSKRCRPPAAAIGQQLWRKLLDTMEAHAAWLKHLLSESWINKADAALVSDSVTSRDTEVKSRTSRSSVDSRRREKKTSDGARKRGKGKKEVSQTDASPENLEMMETYRGLLHQKVYALMEDLVESLCELVDELDEGGGLDDA